MSYGILFINGAFVLYTVGVWSEKIQGRLKRGHLILFWLGIVCDVLGTSAMGEIAKGHVASIIPITSGFHSLTGIIALLLMLLHTCWATVIIATHKESWIQKFHRYSLIVWLIWLLPFISGAMVHFL